VLTEKQINKWVNFICVVEALIPNFKLRGYEEDILDSKDKCPICDTQLNEYSMYGEKHELWFDFFFGTYHCVHEYKKKNEGNIIDFITIVKKSSKAEAVSWINELINRPD
jgi:hypothetical protein